LRFNVITSVVTSYVNPRLDYYYYYYYYYYSGFWWENLRKGDHLGDPGVDGRIILR
jgi:hypothetical protein